MDFTVFTQFIFLCIATSIGFVCGIFHGMMKFRKSRVQHKNWYGH